MDPHKLAVRGIEWITSVLIVVLMLLWAAHLSIDAYRWWIK